jgi:hypothetical protein
MFKPTVGIAKQLVVAAAIGRVDVEITVVVVIDPIGLTGRSVGDGEADGSSNVGKLLPAVVAQHDRQLVSRRGATEQIDEAVAVEVAPAQAAELVAAGLRRSQLCANADEQALVVAVETNFATAEGHGQIEIAVVVVVAPRV